MCYNIIVTLIVPKRGERKGTMKKALMLFVAILVTGFIYTMRPVALVMASKGQ